MAHQQPSSNGHSIRRVGSPLPSSFSPPDRPAGQTQKRVESLKAQNARLKTDLEAERLAYKRLKHNRVSELQAARAEEQKRASEAQYALKQKLEAERVKDLETLRDSLSKQMYSERNKLLKQKDSLAKSQGEQQRDSESTMQKLKNQYLMEAKEEARKHHESERIRFQNETLELKSVKKRLETDLENSLAANRQNSSELRRVSEEQSREMDRLKKDARKDIIQLVDELTAKGRVIGELEKELGQRAGYALRLQAEKDSLGQELNLAKMADRWERRSQSTGRKLSDSHAARSLPDISRNNEGRKQRVASPSPQSGIPRPTPSPREGDSQPKRPRQDSTKSQAGGNDTPRMKSPVSRIPTATASLASKRTPSPGQGKNMPSISTRRSKSPHLAGTNMARMRSSPVSHQGGGGASSTVSWAEDIPAANGSVSRTTTPISLASSDGLDLDLQCTSPVPMVATAWDKEKDVFKEEIALLKKALSEMAETKSRLEWSLRQSSDQNDLLEFRVLELEESKKENDERAEERESVDEGAEKGENGFQTTSEQLTGPSEKGAKNTTQPTQLDSSWDLQLNSELDQLNYANIPELKQKLDQISCKEDSSVSEDQKTFINAISKVLQSANETIENYVQANGDMQKQLNAMVEMYQGLEEENRKQREDNQNLEKKTQDQGRAMEELLAETSSYKVLLEMKSSKMEELAADNQRMTRQITDMGGDTQVEDGYREKIADLEKLVQEQNYHIETLCNKHAEMETELERHQNYILDLEGDRKEENTEKDNFENLVALESAVPYQNGRRHSSTMETSTDQFSSDVQVESLWEEIEGAKSSETDTQLNFLQDHSDQDGETSIVEELFQVLEKGADKPPLHSSMMEDPQGVQDVENVEKEPQPADNVNDDDDDTDDSSFSLPLPDDDVDDESSTSKKPPLRRKLSAEMFGGITSEASSRRDSGSELEAIQDLPEADAATRVFDSEGENRDGKRDLEDGVKHKQDTIPASGGQKSMYGNADDTDDGEDIDDDDEQWDENEIIKKLEEKQESVPEQEVEVANQMTEDLDISSDIDDTQTDFSELVSQNEELKAQIHQKDEEIKDMSDTTRILKQVIKDQMTECEKMREEDAENSMDEQLEYKMKEDTLKRVIKDLQKSEQTLKKQLNRLTEDNEELRLKMKSNNEKLDESKLDSSREEHLAERCRLAEERVQQMQKFNVDVLEKYELEIDEKDAMNKQLDDENQSLMEVKEDLEMKLACTEKDLKERDERIQSMEFEKEEHEKGDLQKVEREKQLESQIGKMEEVVEAVQKELASKCVELEKENQQFNDLKQINEDLNSKLEHAEHDLVLKEELMNSLKGDIEKQEKEDSEKEEKQNLDQKVTELQKLLENVQEDLARKNTEVVQLQAQLELSEEERKTEREESSNVIQELEQNCESAKDKQIDLENQVTERENENKELHLKLDLLEESVKSQLMERDEILIQMRDQLEESKLQTDNGNQELSSLKEQLAELQDSNENLISKSDMEVASRVAEVANVTAALAVMEENLRSEQNAKVSLATKNQLLETQLGEMEDKLKHLEDDKVLDIDNKQLEEISMLRKSFEDTKSELEDALQSNKLLQDELNESKIKAQQAEKITAISSGLSNAVCEDLITPSQEVETESVPELDGTSREVENLKQQLAESEATVEELEKQMKVLETDKALGEERMRGIEDLLKDSVIDNEDMLRERIVELEVTEKGLLRKVQELEASQKEADEKIESTLQELKDVEESYEDKFKQLRQAEQVQLERAAELEESGNQWKSQSETLKEKVENLDSLNQGLKQRLKEAEAELEELQVVSKLAGDELGGTQQSLPSLMDEGLGALDTGRTFNSHYDEDYEEDYEEDGDEDFELSDDLPQGNAAKMEEQHGETVEYLKQRVALLEKSESELMEKVEILEQSEGELAELLDSLQQNEAVVLEASQQLEEERQRNLELADNMQEIKTSNQELQEQVAEIEIERDELLLKLDEMSELGDKNPDTSQQFHTENERLKAEIAELQSKLSNLEQQNQEFIEKSEEIELERDELHLKLDDMSELDSKNAANSEQLQTENEQLKEEISNFQSKLSNLEQQNHELFEKSTETAGTGDHMTEMKTENDELRHSLQEADTKNKELMSKLTEFEQLEHLQPEIEQLQTDLKKSSKVQGELQVEIDELKINNENLTVKLQELSENDGKLKMEYAQLQEKYKELKTTNEELLTKLDEAEARAGNASALFTEENLTKIENENLQITQELQQAEDERLNYKELIKNMEAEIQFLEEQKAGGEQSIAELSFQIETLQEEFDTTSKKLEHNESILDEQQKEIADLRRELDDKLIMLGELENRNLNIQDECVLKTKMLENNANIIEKKMIELDATKKDLQAMTETCQRLQESVSDLEEIVENLSRGNDAGERIDGVKEDLVEEEIVSRREESKMMMPPPRTYSNRQRNRYDDSEDSGDNVDRIETAPTIEALQLRIQHLLDNEEQLQEKIYELEQRQSAFNETLAQADDIMKEREKEFIDEISELETSNSDLKEKLQDAMKGEQKMKRKPSLTTSQTEEGDYSIFDCIDEEDDDSYSYGDEEIVSEEDDTSIKSGPPARAPRRRSSVKVPPQILKKAISNDTLIQSQEKIADLMIKVDDLEKQNADLLQALKQKEGTSGSDSQNPDVHDLQAALREANQELSDNAAEVQSLKDRVEQLKDVEDQVKQLMAERELSEADRNYRNGDSATHGYTKEDVRELKERISELESSREELKEELSDAKLSEETLTEISEEQDKEIQRLKEELHRQTLQISERQDESSKDFEQKLFAANGQNKDYATQVQVLSDDIKALKERNIELENSERKLEEDLGESEKTRMSSKQAQEEFQNRAKTLEDTIEMLTSKMQESEMGKAKVNASNKVLESKFKDMLMAEAGLKDKLKQAEDSAKSLREKVASFERADNKWRQEMQEMEDAILNTKRESRRFEEELKLLKIERDQLKHESNLLTQKAESSKSQELQAQNLLSEMEISESNLRLQLKNSEAREGKLQEQVRDLENAIASAKRKDSSTSQLESELESLQMDLQAATRRADGLERSNVKLEEQLQQLQDNLRSQGMVSLPVSEYQELKAQAAFASLTDGGSPGPKEGGAAGEVWMRLDQKNKELREVQELYNQSVRECVKVKQSLRDLQVKEAGHTMSSFHQSDSGVVKATQTTPLRLLTKGALQVRIMADGDSMALGEFLDALPLQDLDYASTVPMTVNAPIIQAGRDLIQVDQSAPSFLHRQPIREQPIGEEEEEAGHVSMATRPDADDGFDFDNVGLAVDEIDRLRVGSSLSDPDVSLSLSSDAPPLPDTAPPGQHKSPRRANSASSDISDLAPPPPPLPSLPPPGKLGRGGVLEEEDLLVPVSSEQFHMAPPLPAHFRAPSFDSGLDTQASITEPEIEATPSQDAHTGGPPELRLPTVPGGSKAPPPPVAPKPGTPLWLKKMMDWQSAEKEKEHGEMGRLRARAEQLTRTNNEQEEQLRQLKVEREQLRRQLQGASDARQLQHKLQNRDLELEERERQVTRLKTEIKERDMEVVRLKSQLEALSQAGQTSSSEEMAKWRLKDQLERTREEMKEKEHMIHSHDAQLGRVKADLLKKEAELMSKEATLKLKLDELTLLREKIHMLEEGQRSDTSRHDLAEKASQVAVLTAENGVLRGRVCELEPLESRVAELELELGRNTHSTRSLEALERKLQLAHKMLHDKTEQEMRLAEDNTCLQQRLHTMQTQDKYSKDLHKDYQASEEQLATLEHERNEAELAVAPLKAKVSYLTKKCQERDELIRKLKHEISRVKSERTTDLMDQIDNLSQLLPEEAYNEPLKTRPRRSKPGQQPKRTSRTRNLSPIPDLLGLLDEDERDFLKRESLEERDLLLDNGDGGGGGGGEISIEELLQRTKGHRAIGSPLEDINLDELDVMETVEEVIGDQFLPGHDIGLGKTNRRRRSPVSYDFSSNTLPKSRKSRAPQTKLPSFEVDTSLSLLGLDMHDGPVSPLLATHPNSLGVPHHKKHHTPHKQQHQQHQPHLQGQHLVQQPQQQSRPHQQQQSPGALSSAATIPSSYQPPSQHHPHVYPSQPVGQMSRPAPLSHSTTQHPLDPMANPFSGHPSYPQPQTQMLNNNIARPPHLTAQPVHPTGYNLQPVANVPGPSAAPSIGVSLPLSHQNVRNLAGAQMTNGHLMSSQLPAGITGHTKAGSGVPDPPKSLSVSREVSRHSVLLTWVPPLLDMLSCSQGVEVVGYRIYVDGQQKQQVASAHLTKALVDGIFTKSAHIFGICTLGASGATSTTTELIFNPTSSTVPSSTASESGRSESVPDVSSEASSSGRGHAHKEERLFMAIYTYDPDSHSPNDNPDYELSFTEGDMITVYGHARPDGFYHGKAGGRKGLVPSNFIEEIPDSDTRKKASRESLPKKSRDRHHQDERRTRERRGRSERDSRRREGQAHRGSRV